jgi:hypothetical protein
VRQKRCQGRKGVRVEKEKVAEKEKVSEGKGVRNLFGEG